MNFRSRHAINEPRPICVRRRVRFQPGLTLIEIVISLSVLAVLAGISAARASEFLEGIAVRGAVTEIESLFGLARQAAIGRTAQASLDIDSPRGTVIVRVGPDTLRRRDLMREHGVSISANRPSVTYSPTGVGYGASNLTLVVSRRRSADTIYVSRLGRVRH